MSRWTTTSQPTRDDLMLIGELMALGYDPTLREVGPCNYVLTVPAGQGLWAIGLDGWAAFYAHVDDFDADGAPAVYDADIDLDADEVFPTPERVAYFLSTVAEGTEYPAPVRTIAVAKAPLYLSRETYTGRWWMDRFKPGYGARTFTAAEVAAHAASGAIWKDSGSVHGRVTYFRERYLADADGNLHLYDSNGRKVGVHRADKPLSIATRLP